ncbi:hypothetical protein MKW94_026302, partial [Papaver nudicaule]|nr:hypothetical protein [Papaver nudicaule]
KMLEILNKNNEKCTPRRRVPATRDFPVACGSKFPIISRMECLRLVSSSENIDLDSDSESMQSEQMLEADFRDITRISKNVQDGHWTQLNKRKLHEEFEDARPASNRFEGNKSIVLAPFSGERVIVQALMATPNCPWRNTTKRFVKSQELVAAPNSTRRRQAKQVVKSEGEKSIVLASSERIIVQSLMAAPHCPWRIQSKRFAKSQGLMTAPDIAFRGREIQLVKSQGEEKSVVLAPSSSERVIVQGLMATRNWPQRQAKRDSKSTAQETQLVKFQVEEKSIVPAPSSSERVIVQGLMAARNCPWRQAKRDSKSTARGITKSEVSMQAISLYFRE